MLYLGCHVTMEYDDIRLFTELGFEVFSIGNYTLPDKPGHTKGHIDKRFRHDRPPLAPNKNKDIADHFFRLNPNYETYKPIQLDQAFVNKFDVIFISHFNFYFSHLPLFKGKPIIYHTVGQIHPQLELLLKKLRTKADFSIVRFHENEGNLKNFAGIDAAIPMYVEEDKYFGWTGTDKIVATVGRGMKSRKVELNYEVFESITDGFPRKIYGMSNEDLPYWGGELSFQDLIDVYKTIRVYLNTGTKPAPFTYSFVEALMTGCPIVAVGPKLGNYNLTSSGWGQSYAVHEFLENGHNGFWADDIPTLKCYIEHLLKSEDECVRISRNARETAIKHWSKEVIKNKWKELFSRKAIEY